MKQIKDVWNNLDKRQKRLSLLALVITICLFYYVIIWEPIHDGVLRLRQDIRNDQTLLVWMKQANVQLKRRGTTQTNNELAGQKSLLAMTEKSLQQAQLSSAIKEIKQMGEGLRLSFENVKYVDFLKWLDDFQTKAGIKIERVKMRRADQPGIISVELIFER